MLLQAQRTITGKVINETGLTIITGAKIQSLDRLLLGSTDRSGFFKIELPPGCNQLLINSLGMESMSIAITDTCNYLEIILMNDTIYDFVTSQVANRRRHRKFKNLKNKHRQAGDKGIFTSNIPCVKYMFQEY
ncbi:hypothetical protein [Dyadobacter psychrotolerans]|uniref:Carboxypeptidase-like regulatory domain-containing protein n=1 Tax=Dyadobacter psychrotolerans TaxID=2541721 RepID=A0A4R5DAP1_9BACT|nr:hypothetical protein [Dyadobacter psychrotolerans]TDE09030.1 hypothetical protein E0F88_31605 [Dyadobacter psychrotolerans]